MVDSIKYLARSIKGAIISTQVVLIRRLRFRVSEYFRSLLPAQTGLNQAGRRGAPETSETQSARFTVFDTSSATRALEGSLYGSNAKDGLRIILLGLFPQGFELQAKPISNRDGARLSGLGGHRADLDLGFLNVAPLQSKDFARSHSGIEGADQNSLQVLTSAGTRRKQLNFFFERQHTDTFALLRNRDQRLTFAKRTFGDPSFPLSNVEKTASQSKFAVYAGKTPALPAFGLSSQSVHLVGLEIVIGDRTDSTLLEKRIEGARISAYRSTGAQASHFPIINVDRGDSIAIQIPLHHNGEFSVRPVAAGGIQHLPFFERLAQPIARFCFGGAGAPKSFTLPVLHPGNAGVNVSVSDYDLDFMVSGHLLSDKLYIRKLDRDGKSNRETDSDSAGEKNQGEMKAIDVLSYFGQDYDEEIDLTSDQKVAGSSPAGCIKTSTKSSNQKVRLPLTGTTTRCSIRSRIEAVA